MKFLLTKYKKQLYFLFPILLVGGLAYAVTTFGSTPLFDSTEDFVLFSNEKITLEQKTQISSGFLGSNNGIHIKKENIVNSDMFADEIALDKETQVNGNISYNKLTTQKSTQVFGVQTNQVNLLIAVIPDIPEFQPGQDNVIVAGDTNTLNQGNYFNILLKKSSKQQIQHTKQSNIKDTSNTNKNINTFKNINDSNNNNSPNINASKDSNVNNKNDSNSLYGT